MLVHEGSSVNSGHYYSYVKASNNDWYIFNDHSVKKAEKNKILIQKPYLLFYEKIIEKNNKKIFFETSKKNVDQIINCERDITNNNSKENFMISEKNLNSNKSRILSNIFNRDNNIKNSSIRLTKIENENKLKIILEEKKNNVENNPKKHYSLRK